VKVKHNWRAIAMRACVILTVLISLPMLAIPSQQQTATPEQKQAASAPRSSNLDSATTNAQSSPSSDRQLPDSPGTVYAQNLAQAQATEAQETSLQQGQDTKQKPVGTAAARTATPAGVAASEPAGSAIAPAKQRRVRTILISVGAVLGAGAAVGAVAALSSASPSRPPGAH